jgi:hypothetical protein
LHSAADFRVRISIKRHIDFVTTEIYARGPKRAAGFFVARSTRALFAWRSRRFLWLGALQRRSVPRLFTKLAGR